MILTLMNSHPRADSSRDTGGGPKSHVFSSMGRTPRMYIPLFNPVYPPAAQAHKAMEPSRHQHGKEWPGFPSRPSRGCDLIKTQDRRGQVLLPSTTSILRLFQTQCLALRVSELAEQQEQPHFPGQKDEEGGSGWLRVWVARPDTAQLLALGPCPFCDTISLETDDGENAELINSSIDPSFSIQEIDLPIRKGREAPSEGPERPRDPLSLGAGVATGPVLSSVLWSSQ